LVGRLPALIVACVDLYLARAWVSGVMISFLSGSVVGWDFG